MLSAETLESFSHEKKQTLLSLFNETDWLKSTEKKGAVLLKRPSPNSPISQVRVEITVDRPAEGIFTFLADTANYTLIDPSLEVLNEMMSLNDDMNIKLAHILYKMPVVSNREAVVCMFESHHENLLVVGEASVNPQDVDAEPSNKKSVWCDVHVSGYILVPESDSLTRVISLGDVNPCGSIPAWIINKLIDQQVTTAIDLKKLLESNL
ncbi:hypothetical protein GEMRC1_012452 [Eukaryota sp. GEM-RC1]